MVTENLQAEASVQWLAELECRDCDEGFGYGFVPDADNPHVEKTACLTCQGTGALYPQLRKYYQVGKSWLPVSREKAGTEGRKLEEFQKYLHTQACDVRLSCQPIAETVGYCIEILCNDNLVIAAWRKKEEGE